MRNNSRNLYYQPLTIVCDDVFISIDIISVGILNMITMIDAIACLNSIDDTNINIIDTDIVYRVLPIAHRRLPIANCLLLLQCLVLKFRLPSRAPATLGDSKVWEALMVPSSAHPTKARNYVYHNRHHCLLLNTNREYQ